MKVMSVIHFLVRLEVVVAVISGHDDVLHSSHGADAVPDDPQDCGQSPVQSQEVFVLQHGADGVPAQRGVEGGGEAEGGRDAGVLEEFRVTSSSGCGHVIAGCAQVFVTTEIITDLLI